MKSVVWEKYIILFSIGFSSFLLYSFVSEDTFDLWVGSEEKISAQIQTPNVTQQELEIDEPPPVEQVLVGELSSGEVAAVLEGGSGASVDSKVEVNKNQDKNTATLFSAIQLTLKTYPSVLISKAQSDSFGHQRSKEWGGYLPTADISMNRGVERSKSPTLQASNYDKRDMIREENTVTVRQMLFDGFAVSNRVKSAENLFQRSKQNVRVTKETTGLRVIDVYLNVLRSKELIDIAKEKVSQHESILSTVEEREKKGVGRASDTEQVRGRLSLAKAQVERYRAGLANALSSYESVVGERPTRLALVSLQEVTEVLPSTLDFATLSAKEKHAVLKQAHFDVASAKADVSESKAAFWPQLHLQLDGSDTRNLDGIEGKSNDFQAKVVLSFNIFNGTADLQEKKSRAALLREKRYSQELAKRNIQKDVHIAWNFLESSKQDFRYFSDHRDASQAAFDAYQEQYLIAKRTLFDLLNSADELSKSEEAAVNARYTTILRSYELLYAMGDLLGVMGVDEYDTSVVSIPEEKMIDIPR